MTLYPHGRSAQVDPRPKVSDFEFEVVVGIHAALRISCRPAVRISIHSIPGTGRDHADRKDFGTLFPLAREL